MSNGFAEYISNREKMWNLIIWCEDLEALVLNLPLRPTDLGNAQVYQSSINYQN